MCSESVVNTVIKNSIDQSKLSCSCPINQMFNLQKYRKKNFLVRKTIFKDVKTCPHNFGNSFREGRLDVIN